VGLVRGWRRLGCLLLGIIMRWWRSSRCTRLRVGSILVVGLFEGRFIVYRRRLVFNPMYKVIDDLYMMNI